MEKINPKVEKNLLDLKYQRYLQKIHTVFNITVLITISIFGIVIAALLAKQITLSFSLVLVTLLPISGFWTIAISIRKITNNKRKEVVNRLLELGKINF